MSVCRRRPQRPLIQLTQVRSGGQVTPLVIDTEDGEKLFAWHVLHQSRALSNAPSAKAFPLTTADFKQTEAFRLLSRPGARLIISCKPIQSANGSGSILLTIPVHGNAGHVGQMWRPTHLRTLLSDGDEDVHVLTFDYRGFAHSTGYPTEQGVIVDGISVVDWAMSQANIAPARIVLVGHSLGTAASSAVYHHFHKAGKPLAGLVLIAAFTDVPTLLDTYRMGGVIPILAPLRVLPPLQRFFADQTADKWETLHRLSDVVASGRPYNIHLFHSKTDMEISCHQSFALFNALSSGKKAYDPTAPPRFNEAGARLASGRTVWHATHQPDVSRCLKLSLFLTGCEWPILYNGRSLS